MEVKNPAARIAPAAPVTRAQPVSPPAEAETAAPVSTDAFAGAKASAVIAPQAPVQGASEAALWGAEEVAAPESAPAAVAKPSFAGVKLEKSPWGQPALTFTVQKGDTLSKLGARAGVDYQSLANFNLIENPNVIQVGQKIMIPTTFHEVKKGDTYFGIARNLGIDPKLLMQLNKAPPDGLLRVGQEIQVPASIVTEAQAQTRAKLVNLLDNAAAAESKLYFGPGSFRPRHIGNDLGFTGVADTDARFEFSDDFSTVKAKRGQGDEPATVTRLENPVRDMRKMVVAATIGQVANLRAQQLREQHPEFPGAFSVKGPRNHKDGTVEFVITAPADGEDYLRYDPKAGTLTISDNSDRRTVLDVKRPTDVVDALQKHYRLKLPAYA